jgi:hypothetical protein
MLEFGRRRRNREFDLPEVVLVGEEGDAVGVDVVLRSDFTDDADFSFAIGVEGAEIQLLLGKEFEAGENAGTVLAEDDGVGVLGKRLSVGVAAHKDNGNLLGKTPAAADFGVRHLGNLGKGPRLNTRIG